MFIYFFFVKFLSKKKKKVYDAELYELLHDDFLNSLTGG